MDEAEYILYMNQELEKLVNDKNYIFLDNSTLASDKGFLNIFIKLLCETFIFFIIISSSFGLSVCVISYYIYRPMLNWSNLRKLKYEDSEFEEDEYPYKYFEELDELKERDLSDHELLELRDKVVTENTPRGEVILYYNKDSETFFYYCQSKEIPYKYLEAVARHYVCIYDCKNLYIDDDKNKNKVVSDYCKDGHELKTGKECEKHEGRGDEDEEDEEGEENSKKTEKMNVFASFKSYNKENIKITTDYEKKVNRYTYKGKLGDYEKEKINKINDEEIVEVDFASFKKIVQDKADLEDEVLINNDDQVKLDREVKTNLDDKWRTDWWWYKKEV